SLVWRHRGDVFAVEQDLAGGRALEAGDHPQRRRLAAARRTEQREEFARVDEGVDAVDRDRLVEALGQRAELNLAAGHYAAASSPERSRRADTFVFEVRRPSAV